MASRLALATAVLLVGAFAAAVALQPRDSTEVIGPGLDPRVTIADGLTPSLTAAHVGQIVTETLTAAARRFGRSTPIVIETIRAVPAGAVEALEPATGHGSPPSVGVRWVVRARGPFVGERVPAGMQPIFQDSGFFIIDDATGTILQMGMP